MKIAPSAITKAEEINLQLEGVFHNYKNGIYSFVTKSEVPTGSHTFGTVVSSKPFKGKFLTKVK